MLGVWLWLWLWLCLGLCVSGCVCRGMSMSRVNSSVKAMV